MSPPLKKISFSFIQLSFLDTTVASDETSLFALNWPNAVSDTQQKPAPCKRFIKLGLDASIIAASHMFFGKETTENTPTKHTISRELATGLKVVRQRFFIEWSKNSFEPM